MGRARAMAVVLALVVALAGCGEGDPGGRQACAERSGALVEERAVEVAYRHPGRNGVDVIRNGELAGARRGFVLQAINSQELVERLQLTFDGRTALDVDLPAQDWCWGGHGPVFTFGWELPSGPVEAVLTIQRSASTHRFTVPEEGTVFGVVDIQGERAWGDMRISSEASVWG